MTNERDELAQAWADGIEAGRIKAVMMRREIRVPVLPDYVQNYLDDGWAIVEGEK